MKSKILLFIALFGTAATVLSGCQTAKSAIPYEASTESVNAIRTVLGPKKISVNNVTLALWVSENLMCRMQEEVNVSPDRTLTQYIKDALQKDLLTAQAYDAHGPAIEGRIEELSFSSTEPAYWFIRMHVYSSTSNGYTVSVTHPFETSWIAIKACKDTTNAFAPAVQDLIKQVVTNPQFASLFDK